MSKTTLVAYWVEYKRDKNKNYGAYTLNHILKH